jgi:hypothetical protein
MKMICEKVHDKFCINCHHARIHESDNDCTSFECAVRELECKCIPYNIDEPIEKHDIESIMKLVEELVNRTSDDEDPATFTERCTLYKQIENAIMKYGEYSIAEYFQEMENELMTTKENTNES